jgi:hypothetical protein
MSTRAPAAGVLEELHELLREEQGALAEALRPRSADLGGQEVFASLVAEGRRAARDPRGYALLVESILEGYLLHYASGRLLDRGDRDLRLLAGDYLYAFGLTRLARIGDLEAVDELADLISLCAAAHAPAASDSEDNAPWRLTAALWGLAVLAVAGGSWPQQREAKRLARAQGTRAAQDVLAAAIEQAESVGAGVRLERALIAFGHAVEGEFSTT